MQLGEYSPNDLRKLSRSFRVIASRLLASDYEEAVNNLRRFVDFIDSEPLISDFIASCTKTDYSIESILSSRKYNSRFDVPLELNDEISFTYQLLKYGVENCVDYQTFSHGYSSSRSLNDWVQGFHRVVVTPFINHIVSYLEEIAMDNEIDKHSKVTINLSGGTGHQLNFAQDHSSIRASNAVDADTRVTDLNQSVEQLLKIMSDDTEVPNDSKNDAKEVLELMRDEANRSEPKRSILSMCINNLQGMAALFRTTAQLEEGLRAVIQHGSSLLHM